MTILAPILMAALIIVPVLISIASEKREEASVIGVLDNSGFYSDSFVNTDKYTFISYDNTSVEDGTQQIINKTINYLVVIPKPADTAFPERVYIYGDKDINGNFESFVKNTMRDKLQTAKYIAAGIDPDLLKSIYTKINLETYKINDEGQTKRTYSEVGTGVGLFVGLMMYMFIFMFGGQVMRSVMEEKTSRIVEVIISSVKPFQLMMGKIIGTGLLGLTQFFIWIVLTAVLVAGATAFIPGMEGQQAAQQMGQLSSISSAMPVDQILADDSVVAEIFTMIQSINISQLLIFFLLFFIGGYMLYSSMFAAVAGSVDNDSDTQQFTLPLSLPLILPIMMMNMIVNDPSGPVSFWLSMIPFTSPITMMMRIPFGVPIWQLLLSVALLYVTFVIVTKFAGKIYHTGILMYGKKITWGDMIKWIKVK